jgi:CheY-like chemotaxis protein
MLGKNPPSAGPLKAKIAENIRDADLLVKEGRFDDAVIRLERALQLDPQNYFARSFLERLRVQMERRPRKISEQGVQSTEADEGKIEQIATLLRSAGKLITEKDYAHALQQVVKVYAIDPKNFFARGYADRIDQLMNEEKKSPGRVPPTEGTASRAVPAAAAAQEAAWKEGERASLAMYREMLKEMWFDGKITEEETKHLQNARSVFGITDQEHAQLQKEVQIDAYVEALRIAWRDGVVSRNEDEVLKLMRDKFNITLEEHVSAEARILWAKNTPQGKCSILFVDDEPTFLMTQARLLKKHGYEVVTAENAEEALKLLQETIPSIIIADLLMGEGLMTGIEFYQKVRENPRLSNIPYLIVSGISDDFVVRAGMRLGVDNFIRKPFDFGTLLAIVEGKLK